MAAPLVADLRTQHFQKLYQAFREYFEEQLRKDASAVAKFKLQLSTEFFDDLNLYQKVAGLFSEANSNPAEKKAVARAALWDALVAHHFGEFTNQLYSGFANRITDLEEKLDGLFKGKQTGQGTDTGVQKQDDSVGLGGTPKEGC